MNKVLSTWFRRYLSHPEAVALLIIFITTIIIFKTMGQVLTPIIFGAIIAYLLSGVVQKLQRWHCPRLLAVSLVFSLFMVLLLLTCLWLLPLLWDEMVNLVTEIPAVFNNAQVSVFKLHEMFPELISIKQLQQGVLQITTYLANFGKEVVTFSLTSLFGIVTMGVYLVLVPFLIFFFLRDGRDIMKWFINFLPAKRHMLEGVWYELHEKIHSYIQGKIIEVTIVSVVTMIAFGVLGLRYAVLLGALVGISVVIPYVGIVVVTAPIVVIGLIQWGWSEHFFYLMLVYAIIIVLDANVLVPLLFSEVMNLHPLAIILSVLFFGNIFGFWGVFFAIPLMTLVSVVVKSWPKENKEYG
ncbi:MAG TPA: AI-2E family transporter [Coxiellaceae bacterium]|nr:MAG: hypothetical protein A2V89_05485 [Gammaproteobacteria bacterium RBG_16_37_9]HBC72116.1 AI-2E family transporter [Coxiellaceae bacterium]HBS52272.1 AI-2E family transporter [Coxiellaceae bacterium]